MIMWLVIFGCVIAAALACVIYLVTRIRRTAPVQKLTRGKKVPAALLSLAILAAFSAVLILTLNLMNAIICLLHLAVFRLLADAALAIAQKCRRKAFSRYYGGILALAATVVYLGIGAYLAYHVSRTEYRIETDKAVPALRIVQFADSHLGSTFDAEGLAAHIETINAENPDLVLITGDLVDDGTTREELFAGCRALSALKAKYGVYFCYGNHDKGYNSTASRGWSAEELETALRQNGVIVLEDETADIAEHFCLIGRRDRGEAERMTMQQLTEGLDPQKFSIVLDHQPGDYDAQAESGVDLVLSGHTHGGQLLPVTLVGEWIGVNCRTYGYEKRKNTQFIVTSGISDWTIKFKTGCKSEYVVIDIA